MGSVSLGLFVAACNAHCGWIINRRGVCVVTFALALTIISTAQNPEMDTQSGRQIEIAKKSKVLILLPERYKMKRTKIICTNGPSPFSERRVAWVKYR
jgi:hypothetical protein